MSFFDLFRKRTAKSALEPADTVLRQQLVELVMGMLREPHGRIRAEDAISAAATIVGERCIDVAGDFPLRDHEMAPASRVFSTRANEVICGDVIEGSVSQSPKDSIAGILLSRLDPKVYTDAHFPALAEIFKQYAAHVGSRDDWGKVPLSVGDDHLPFLPPLRVG